MRDRGFQVSSAFVIECIFAQTKRLDFVTTKWYSIKMRIAKYMWVDLVRTMRLLYPVLAPSHPRKINNTNELLMLEAYDWQRKSTHINFQIHSYLMVAALTIQRISRKCLAKFSTFECLKIGKMYLGLIKNAHAVYWWYYIDDVALVERLAGKTHSHTQPHIHCNSASGNGIDQKRLMNNSSRLQNHAVEFVKVISSIVVINFSNVRVANKLVESMCSAQSAMFFKSKSN